MFPWSRKEIYCGFSAQEFAAVRNILARNGIRYDYRIVSQNRGSRTAWRGGAGVPFADPEHTDLYYVYVHYKEFEQSRQLLRQSK